MKGGPICLGCWNVCATVWWATTSLRTMFSRGRSSRRTKWVFSVRSIDRLNLERNRNLFFFYRTNEFIIFSGNYFYNYRFLLFAPVITSPVSFHFLNEFHANKSIEYNLIIYIRIIRNTDLCFYSFQYLHYELSFHYLYLMVKNNFYTKRIYFDVAKLHA